MPGKVNGMSKVPVGRPLPIWSKVPDNLGETALLGVAEKKGQWDLPPLKGS